MGRKRKSEFEVKKSKIPNGERVWYIIGRPNGIRQRAWFKTQEAAKAEANERNINVQNVGGSVMIDHALIADAKDAVARLQPHGKSIRDAVTYYLAHLEKLSKSVSVPIFTARILAEYA